MGKLKLKKKGAQSEESSPPSTESTPKENQDPNIDTTVTKGEKRPHATEEPSESDGFVSEDSYSDFSVPSESSDDDGSDWDDGDESDEPKPKGKSKAPPKKQQRIQAPMKCTNAKQTTVSKPRGPVKKPSTPKKLSPVRSKKKNLQQATESNTFESVVASPKSELSSPAPTPPPSRPSTLATPRKASTSPSVLKAKSGISPRATNSSTAAPTHVSKIAPKSSPVSTVPRTAATSAKAGPVGPSPQLPVSMIPRSGLSRVSLGAPPKVLGSSKLNSGRPYRAGLSRPSAALHPRLKNTTTSS
eukprot:Rmarinus@m.8188